MRKIFIPGTDDDAADFNEGDISEKGSTHDDTQHKPVINKSRVPRVFIDKKKAHTPGMRAASPLTKTVATPEPHRVNMGQEETKKTLSQTLSSKKVVLENPRGYNNKPVPTKKSSFQVAPLSIEKEEEDTFQTAVEGVLDIQYPPEIPHQPLQRSEDEDSGVFVTAQCADAGEDPFENNAGVAQPKSCVTARMVMSGTSIGLQRQKHPSSELKPYSIVLKPRQNNM